ncbi:MAG: GGDEF domain-containing protein, partial [Oscillospiraceae bacterium]|nr:GGDEF domain-containing protein [Oscillospiraceae bacterium]
LVSLVMVVVIFLCFSVLEICSVTKRTHENAGQIFGQIRQILLQNETDLEETQQQYYELRLDNARAIAYILEHNPEILEKRNMEELLKVADFIQVDEIHIFNDEGVIVFGTEPRYYGYSFDSGEQIGFFKPLQDDPSLCLVQDITPNTAEGKPVQYSALWSENESFIVQIGMYPETVLKAREKNELSFIFSLLQTNGGSELYATDIESGTVLGCTSRQYLNRPQTDIGLPAPEEIDTDEGFAAVINGIHSYAIFTRQDDMLIGYVTPLNTMYGSTVHSCLLFALGLLLIAFIVVRVVSRFVNSFVIEDIHRINEDLRRITDGDLDVDVDIQSSQEFSELSRHINDMVTSLVESRKQIEKDRDMDLLTNLWNRRGLDNELLKLAGSGEDLGHYALIMVDADGLKTVNDVYGHENGDLYLCRVADTLKSAGIRKSVCARQGGDEFVLFLYGYETEELLNGAIDKLRAAQSGQQVELRSGVIVEQQFSIGCSVSEGELDYAAMLKEADARMYEDKRGRHARNECSPR